MPNRAHTTRSGHGRPHASRQRKPNPRDSRCAIAPHEMRTTPQLPAHSAARSARRIRTAAAVDTIAHCSWQRGGLRTGSGAVCGVHS